MIRAPGRTARGLAAIGLSALLAGCMASGRPAPATAGPPGAAPAPRPTVAVLPLEDLAGQSGVSDRLTRIVFTTLARSGTCEVVEPGHVDAALSEARVRSTGMLSQEQITSLAAQLAVRWLLTGSALEYGPVHTPEGDVPSVGIALRLIDGRDGRVRWADQRFRNGDDRETVFGWGRENDIDRLAERTAAELIARLRIPGEEDSTTATGRVKRVDTKKRGEETR